MFGWKKLGTKKSTSEALVKPLPARNLIAEGFQKFQNGENAAAKANFDEILRADPKNSDALYLSGLIENAEGNCTAAVEKLSQAIKADGSVASYYFSLGGIQSALGLHAEAIENFRGALRLDPEDVDTRGALGSELLQINQYLEARDHLHFVVQKDSGNALAHFNLGVIAQKLGRMEDAITHYRTVLVCQPGNEYAENNLGSVWHSLGDCKTAIACFERALSKNPAYSEAIVNMGIALQSDRRVDVALTFFERAVAQDTKNFSAFSNYALALREQGRIDQSLAASQAAIALREDGAEKIRAATLTPVIATSDTETRQWRQRFQVEVNALKQTHMGISDPFREIGTCNFNLAYQPECNRQLQELSASMCLANCPSLAYQAPHCAHGSQAKPGKKIRVGMISRFMYQHSIGRTTRGLLAELDRNSFEVIALFAPPLVDDRISQFIRDKADAYHLLPNSLDKARLAIAELELDILFYQDIGMDAFTYYLAYSRLAPVQCVSFGHPDTTGIPNMDYWVSSENCEIEGAEEHYSEKLYLLRNLGTLAYYYKPELSAAIAAQGKAHYGLSADKNTYLCPQTLFKLHPDFDLLLAGILRGDPEAEIALVEAQSSEWTQRIRERLKTAMPDVAHRIHFVSRMSEEQFLGMISVSDVMLDTLYFNGMNTSLEAIALGTPVVTLPGQMQRARHTLGMYRRMGYEECVAWTVEQYIEIALHLGTDVSYRQAVQREIRARNSVLFEDIQVVREFERFFKQTHKAAKEEAKAHDRPAQRTEGRSLFLVSSAVHAKHGIFDAAQRLQQTLLTCSSIRSRCPSAEIVVLDGGATAMSDEEKASLSEYASAIEDFSNDEDIERAQRSDNENILKNMAEILMYTSYFGRLLKSRIDTADTFSRIFKISGRYQLNDEFDYDLHTRSQGKIIISKSKDSQFSKVITGGLAKQYMSRLWSFDPVLLPDIYCTYENMIKHMVASSPSTQYTDIEHLLYQYLPVDKVDGVDRIGIQGRIAPNGILVHD